jgi:ATP-binding cassette subfamily B protein
MTIIDDYILGISYEWVQVAADDEKVVEFNNKFYKQVRFINDDDVILDDASIVIYKSKFYFADDYVEDGTREVVGNTLTVKAHDDNVLTYQVVKLSRAEVISFYVPILNYLIFFIIILFLKALLIIIFSYIQSLSTGRVMSWMIRDARTDAIRCVERLPISYFESEPAGKMANRISQDVDGLVSLYRIVVNVLTSTILSFGFAYIGMFILNAKLALLTFVIYPFIYLWIRFFLKNLKKIAEKVNELRSLLTAKINEIINGISILQIFNFKKQTISEFNEINYKFTKEQLKETRLHLLAGWNLIGIIRAIITVIIVAYFGWQHMAVTGIVVTAGLIYAYNEYLLKIIEPVNIVFGQVSEFQHAMVKIERFAKITEAELEDDTVREIDRYHGDIVFDNVWFSYKGNDYVLKGVSFKVKSGQFIGLVGHTGSGKSSLMNLLLRFYDLTDEKSGSIYVDNMDISKIPKRTYRYHIGIILQEPTIFKGTIASNISFGKKGVTNKEIIEVLKSIGGEKILEKYKLGIHEPLSRSGVNLSSGEKQIITLARVIVHNPSILIMDEATSHIDTETEAMIQKALEVVARDRTVIIIAHRLSTIYKADKIIVLDHGLKAEEGTHKELIKKNGIYANIYRAQISDVKSS